MIRLAWLRVFALRVASGLTIVFALVAAAVAAFALPDRLPLPILLRQKPILASKACPLLAIPLFLLTGEIMNRGGTTQRLVRLVNALVGDCRGSLGPGNVVSSIFFADLSGSAVEDTSLRSMPIPAIARAVRARRSTATCAEIDSIIPPFISVVISAYVMQVSVATLVFAGLVPGIIPASASCSARA